MNPFIYGRVVSKNDFCPRPQLSSQLKSHILSGQNVLVEGERRVGKTSLICETIRQLPKYNLLYIDLLELKDSDELCRRIVKALITMGNGKNVFGNILKSLSHLKPVISIDPLTGTPSVTVSADKQLQPDSLEAIMDLIYAQSEKKKLVVVFDEFQDILNLSDSSATLGILRSKIQFQHQLSYVFSGSIRSNLNLIFNDPDSPFFKSAIALDVGALEKTAFSEFLKKKMASGNRSIDCLLWDKLFTISQNNPGDMQQLCAVLWECSDQGDMIDLTYLPKALNRIFGMEKKGYEAHLNHLSAQQQRCLIGIAHKGGNALLSSAFLKFIGIAQPASVKKALDRLVELKIIYRINDEYKFTNPFFKAWLVAENI